MKKTVSGTRSKSSIPGTGRRKDCGQRRSRIPLDRRSDFADFQSPTCVFIKNQEPRRENVGARELPTSREPKMPSPVFSGTIPALMTPCGPDRRPDFDALVRMGKHLVARRNVGARLLRLDGRLAAAHDRTENGGRRAFDEGRPAGHRRHRRAEYRTGRSARPSRQGKGRARAHDHPARSVARLVHGGPARPFQPRARGSGRLALRHLQQPLLRLPDQSRTVLRAARRVSPSGRIQGVRRRGVAQLRRRAHRGTVGRHRAYGRGRHPGVPWLRQLRRLRRHHRHRQCAAARSAAARRAFRARRQGRRSGAPPCARA